MFWKRWSVKNRIGFGGQVTYREGTVKTVAPLKAPKVGSLLIKWNWRGNRMRKSMDTHINHAYMRIGIYIVNDRNEWMRTWAANSKALSRSGISAQLMNTKYSSCMSECKAKLKQNTVSTTIASQKGSNIGPPPKPNLLLMN